MNERESYEDGSSVLKSRFIPLVFCTMLTQIISCASSLETASTSKVQTIEDCFNDNNNDAVSVCMTLLENGNQEPRLYHRLALLYDRRGNYPTAKSLIFEGLQTYPDNHNLRWLLESVEYVHQISVVNQLTPSDKPPSHPISALSISRIFASATQFPPSDFKAYGILAFPHRANRDSLERHMMLCREYVSSFSHSSELIENDIEIFSQVVIVWPVTGDFTADKANRLGREFVCPNVIRNYDLYVARKAIEDARIADEAKGDLISRGVLQGEGPFLIGWAPGNEKGQPDAVVLFIDLSRVRTPKQARFIFKQWAENIYQNPDNWSDGWSIPSVKRRIRLWVDYLGPELAAVILNE